MQDGFTFLELMLCLGLIALLALLAAPQYEAFLSRHQAQVEVEQLVRTITLARQQALLRGEVMSLCPDDLTQACGTDWSKGLLLLDEAGNIVVTFTFKYNATLFLKTFPLGHEFLLQFGGSGYTQAQNGSFYYCPENNINPQRVVFNQAGRVYVTGEDAAQECTS